MTGQILHCISARKRKFFVAHLLVGVYVDVALYALLTHVRPAIAGHPLTFALRALVLAEAPLFALIRCEAFAFRTCLEQFLLSK